MQYYSAAIDQNMQTKIIYFYYFFFLILLTTGFSSHAQTRGSDTTIVITDTTNIDALFKRARELSYKENYSQSRRICQKILEKNPFYYDVRTFIGRTYAWQKMYDAARTELSRVLIEKENDYEALNALFDVEFWSENYEVAKDYLKIALGYYPLSEDLLLKKAKLQIKLEDKNGAALTLRRILDLNPGNKDAIQLMNGLEGRKLYNNFQTSYTVDEFDKNKAPQTLVSAQLGRNFTFGSLIIRTTAANKFNKKGSQYELESYINFTRKIYANLSTGFANDEIFPSEKYGVELYFKLPAGFELSTGARYQKFSSGTTFYTASVGNYHKDYWFNLRTFISPKSDSVVEKKTFKNSSITVIGTVRNYFGDSDNYFGLKASRGQSPDERKTLNLAQQSLAYGVGIELQKNAFGRWLFKGEVSYYKEDILGSRYSQRVTTTITVKTVF